jgi:hypothetical protein
LPHIGRWVASGAYRRTNFRRPLIRTDECRRWRASSAPYAPACGHGLSAHATPLEDTVAPGVARHAAVVDARGDFDRVCVLRHIHTAAKQREPDVDRRVAVLSVDAAPLRATYRDPRPASVVQRSRVAAQRFRSDMSERRDPNRRGALLSAGPHRRARGASAGLLARDPQCGRDWTNVSLRGYTNAHTVAGRVAPSPREEVS